MSRKRETGTHNVCGPEFRTHSSNDEQSASTLIRQAGYFFTQTFNLQLQILVFPNLHLEKVFREECFLLHPGWCKQVTIGQLILLVLKDLRLHPTLVDQSVQAVVDLAQTHTKLFGELPLGDLGVLLDLLDYFVLEIFGHDSLRSTGRGTRQPFY
jgi:hypothetical protein